MLSMPGAGEAVVLRRSTGGKRVEEQASQGRLCDVIDQNIGRRTAVSPRGIEGESFQCSVSNHALTIGPAHTGYSTADRGNACAIRI